MVAFAEGKIEPFTQGSLQTFSSSSFFFHIFSISLPQYSLGSEIKVFLACGSLSCGVRRKFEILQDF